MSKVGQRGLFYEAPCHGRLSYWGNLAKTRKPPRTGNSKAEPRPGAIQPATFIFFFLRFRAVQCSRLKGKEITPSSSSAHASPTDADRDEPAEQSDDHNEGI